MGEGRKQQQIANTGSEAIAKTIYGIVYRLSDILVAVDLICEKKGEVMRLKKAMKKEALKIAELSAAIIASPTFNKTEKDKIVNTLDLLERRAGRLSMKINFDELKGEQKGVRLKITIP